jgi:hypothetical protein
MNNVKIAAKCLRVWPDAYRMGAHDRNVCKVAADALDEIEQLRKDNKLLMACVSTAIKYGRMKDSGAALNYLVRKLREAARSD